MRVEFAQAMINAFDKNDSLVFITGDLGYMALEKVQEKFGEKFINAGVAEQNMITVAAALASEGFLPWTYSISPFVTLRPYEQIRNDVCLHKIPVKIVGNGGGYGYGIMGATHHNIEDIGAMRILPNMKVYVPFTANDVELAVQLLGLAARILDPVAGVAVRTAVTVRATDEPLRVGTLALDLGHRRGHEVHHAVGGTDQVARLTAAKGNKPPFDVAFFDTPQVLDAVKEALNPIGVAVVIEAKHLCMMMRGVEKQGSHTVTEHSHGVDTLTQTEKERLWASL